MRTRNDGCESHTTSCEAEADLAAEPPYGPGQRDRNTHLLLVAWKVLLESRRRQAGATPNHGKDRDKRRAD
jgi:hypothetical protein